MNQPGLVYVPVCRCGNLHCQEEALVERCRYERWPLPATGQEKAETIPDVQFELAFGDGR